MSWRLSASALRVHLGEPATDHHGRGVFGEAVVAKRVDHDDVGAGRRQQLDVLGVREGERGAAEDGDDGMGAGLRHASRADSADQISQSSGPADLASSINAARSTCVAMRSASASTAATASGRRSATGTRPRCRLGTTMSGRRGTTPRTGTPVRRDRRAPPSRGGERDVVEDHSGDPHLVVVRREPVHHRTDRARRRGTVDDQHHRRPDQPGHVRGRGEPVGAEGAVEEPHDPFDDGDVGERGSRGPVQQQRRDQLLALEERVQVAADSARRRGRGSSGRCSPDQPCAGTRCTPRRAGRPSTRSRSSSCRGPSRAPLRRTAAGLTTRCPSGPSGPHPSGA